MRNFWLFVLLALPSIICTFNVGSNRLFVNADEDEVDDELIDVENEDGAVTGEDAEIEDETETSSPDADTYLLFTKPIHSAGSQLDLPAGSPVEFLVGFVNKGSDDFVVESVEASFRYPMDFNYYIQNFSAIPYNREVGPGHEATVSYSFFPSDSFAGRPFGLNVALNYRDSKGAHFTESLFNETVQITEVDEGLDGETFFLYVFLSGIVVLLLVVGQQYLAGSVGKRKRAQIQRKTIEMGTNNSADVDYQWLPEETLKLIQQSPQKGGKGSKQTSPNAKNKQSPKSNQTSPRQRKAKRAAGSDD